MFKNAENFLLLLLSITIINGQSANSGIGELRVLKEALHNASVYMEKEAQNENIAICIGTTKSGKSTLINYLMGNPLIADRERPFRPITIKKADNSVGPTIGQNSTSETKIPSRWISKHFPNMVLWDNPGFHDNRRNHQDIINAYYLYQLLQKAESLKIILVVDIKAILDDQISSFIDVLNALEDLMDDKMRDCFASISVIFSKASKTYNEVEVNKTFIKDLLNQNIINSKGTKITPVLRDFVRFLMENEKNMGIFRKPEKKGDISSSDIDVDIVSAISNTVSIGKPIVEKMNPTISPTSVSYLFKAREMLYSNNALESLQDIVSSTLDTEVSHYNSMNSEIKKVKEDLTNFENNLNKALDNCETLYEKIKVLQEIPPMKKKLKEHSLNEKIELGSFIDKALKLKENSILDSSLNAILRSSISKIQHVTCSQIHGLYNKMRITGGIINFKNIKINQCDKNIKVLEIFAAQKVIIDDDLMLNGRKMQITILAPVWEIEDIRTISLNGRDGQNHTELRAATTSTFESNGIDGLPGLPGESAGIFYGVALEIMNGKQLNILANGGRGGNGQNGGNGGNYGGKGGDTGLRGDKGLVVVDELLKNSIGSSVTMQTLEGAHGVRGYGGFAGITYYRDCRNTCKPIFYCIVFDECQILPFFIKAMAREGRRGQFSEDFDSPGLVFQRERDSKNQYKKYATSKSEFASPHYKLKTFYDMLPYSRNLD